MSDSHLEKLLSLRGHLELRANENGVAELGFDFGIVTAAPELASSAGKQRLLSIPGVSGVELFLLRRCVEIRYDPERLDPGFWNAVLQGSEAEARAALEALPPPESA